MKAIDNPARVVKSRKNFGIGIGIRTSGLSGLAVSGLANKFVSEKKVFFSADFLSKKNVFFCKIFGIGIGISPIPTFFGIRD